jgi:hypothetical protein
VHGHCGLYAIVPVGKAFSLDCQPLLAFPASPRQGEYALELADRESHERFYAWSYVRSAGSVWPSGRHP